MPSPGEEGVRERVSEGGGRSGEGVGEKGNAYSKLVSPVIVAPIRVEVEVQFGALELHGLRRGKGR